MTQYFIDWCYKKDLLSRKRHKVYFINLRKPLGTIVIASFRYKRDADAFIKTKEKL